MAVYRIRWIVLCTPGMGVNLWGESPLYENQEVFIMDGYYQKYEPKARASPRGGVRRKPDGKRARRRTETAYKA
jgi:hypothetical protein